MKTQINLRYFCRYCLLLWGISMASLSFSQEVATDTTEEHMDAATFQKLKNSYNYVIQANEEELSMFKIDMLRPVLYALNDWKTDTVGIEFIRLAFEHKWKPAWSWNVGGALKANGDDLLRTRMWGGVRYYYNMNRRILKGKSANNFSADYFGTSLISKYEHLANDFGVSVSLVYGIQRRLRKLGYINFEFGLEGILAPTSTTEVGIDGFSELQFGIAF